MNHIGNGYIVKFFKNFAFIPTLFVAGILTTLLILCEQYGIINTLTFNNYTYYIASVTGLFFILYILYAFSNAKKQTLSISDSVNFAIMLTCILYLIYIIFVLKRVSIARIVIPAVLFLIMLLVSLIRTIYYNPYEEKGVVYYTKHSINAYYHTLFKKYSFFGILMFALGLTCLSFLLLQTGYVFNLSSTKIVIPLILIGIVLALLIFNSISKKIGVLDASILSLTITLIPALLQILLLTPDAIKKVYLIYWAIFCGITLILTSLRYIFFDISKIGKSTAENFEGIRLFSYFKKVSYKYGFGIVLTASFVAVAIFLLMLKFANINEFYKFNDSGKLLIHSNIIPSVIVNILFIGTIILGIALSFANLRASKITFGDFLMLVNLLFSLIASAMFIFEEMFNEKLYCLIAVFVCSFILTIFRITRVCPKSIEKI